ncbi:unnamed protein product, partial [Tilletia caries]
MQFKLAALFVALVSATA